MCSESLPKEFEKTTEVLPFRRHGLSSAEDFREAEREFQHLEWLKKVGLTNDEIKLYRENEEGLVDQHQKIESSVLKSKLDAIYKKINKYQSEASSSKQCEEKPSTSTNTSYNILERLHKKPTKFYPEGHPMNELKEIEESLFGHLKNDNIIPITKRRKILRRFERRKERLLKQERNLSVGIIENEPRVNRLGSLWDMREAPPRVRPQAPETRNDHIIGPKKQTMYTIRDNKIVRLEPMRREREQEEEYQAVDIVMPVNDAEEQLLEGTKMCLEDIKKIERFKDYAPGIPSKVLYLKNIAPSVSQEQLSLLFNQFVLDNGGPVDLRLMTGRMRGQAFVAFQYEHIAIQALEEINGTILSGRPIIAEFGRHSNRIQIEENR